MLAVEEMGRAAGRAAVVDGVDRLDGAVADVNLPTGLTVELEVVRDTVEGAVFFSRGAPAMLDRRSRVEEVFNGGRVEEVPTIDIRLAEPEMPRFSSPELAIDRVFSSAELLIEGRDR